MEMMLEALVLLGFIILALLFHVVFSLRLAKRVRAGAMTRGRAIGLYALVNLSPAVLLLGFFLLLVGLEELFRVAIISDGLARGMPLVAAILLVVWVLSCALHAVHVLRLGARE